MSDDDLIARLRKDDEYEPLGHDGWEAADRIEALTEQLAAARDDAKEAEVYAEEVEADRKKTYEALLHAGSFMQDGLQGIEAAKTAAQADYEARIRSALTVTPHDPAKVQALVEALEYALRVAEHLCSDRLHPVEDVHMMVLSDAKIASLSDARAALAAWKEWE